MKRKSGFPEELLFAADGRESGSRSMVEVRQATELNTYEAADGILRPYLRILGLKRLYRQGWLKRDVPELVCESVADHSFGTAMLALLVAGRPPFQDADPDKACRMAMVHELGEVYAGDITPVDGVSKEDKHALERESLERVVRIAFW